MLYFIIPKGYMNGAEINENLQQDSGWMQQSQAVGDVDMAQGPITNPHLKRESHYSGVRRDQSSVAAA